LSEDTWECDFVQFVEQLQKSGFIARNPDARAAFNQKFHKELAFVSLYLNDLKVTGGELTAHPDPPENCDHCARQISKFGFFVDGNTTSGLWSNMCPSCYAEHGIGIGWGVGQLYRKRNSVQWVCIAGGNPDLEQSG
jgi:hypothetical protein